MLAPGPVLGATCPPRECQVDQDVPVLVVFLVQTAPSVPRTKTEVLTAPGDDVSFPPRECQPDHEVPLHALYHRAPSVPSAKMISRPVDAEETAGPVSVASFPPRECQADQPAVVKYRCHTAPSLPRTKTSRRKLELEPQAIAAGDAVHTPPRESQALLPFIGVCHRVPLVSTAKKSRYPLYPVGTVAPLPVELAAGPVPAIVWPLTLAALLTTAKSETSTVAAMTILISVCL
jgi:hypothetical protein